MSINSLSADVASFFDWNKACGRSPLTVASYRTTLNALIATTPAGNLTESINSDVLAAVMLKLALGVAGHGCGNQLRETTLNRHRAALRAFCRWAHRAGRLSRPAGECLLFARATSIPTLAASAGEVGALFEALARNPCGDPLANRDAALLGCYAFAGLRRAEAVALRCEDVDFQRGLLVVRFGKGGRVRSVPVADRLARMLSPLAADVAADRDASGWMFKGQSSKSHVTVRQAQGRFRVWSLRAGIRPRLTIHSLRVTFATGVHHNTGGDTVLVARALGHTDLRSTLRYVQPHHMRLHDAVNQLAG